MAGWTIVLGLGNPGVRYARTRHNIGFMVVDRLAAAAGVETVRDPELARRVRAAETSFGDRRVVLAVPRTYMNRSARAAAALEARYEAGPERFVVVHDDADLELGRLRVRPDGGTGGHNGLRSLVDHWRGGAFSRVRLGVRGEARDAGPLADYVLAPFDDDEVETVDALVGMGAAAVRAVVADGVERAMNDFNGRRVSPAPPAETPAVRVDDERRDDDRAEEREQS